MDFDFNEMFANARIYRLQKRYPNFDKYPESVKTAMILCEEVVEKCNHILNKTA